MVLRQSSSDVSDINISVIAFRILVHLSFSEITFPGCSLKQIFEKNVKHMLSLDGKPAVTCNPFKVIPQK